MTHRYLWLTGLVILICINLGCRAKSTAKPLPVPPVQPTVPLPSFLGSVYPKPGEELDVASFGFETDTVIPTGILPRAICAELIAAEVLEYGDRGVDRSDHLENLSLTLRNVDKEQISEVMWLVDGLGAVVHYKTNEQTGEVKAIQSAYGPFLVCWQVEIQPGLHFATVEYSTVSGNIYNLEWWFVLRHK